MAGIAHTRRLYGLAALALGGVLVVAANVLAARLLVGVRLDLTADRLFTLSAGTHRVLAKIDEPVTLRFFFSESLGRQIPSYANYAKRVQDMLDEFAASARGRLIVDRLDPAPFTDTEDRAVALGLQAVPIDQSGETVYFGLAGTNSTDDRETIGFFAPERERFLEYDLARLVQSLAQPKRRVVGLVTDLPLEGDVFAMMQGRPTQAWMIVDYLRGQFDLRSLSGDMDRVPDDVDALMLAHPRSLTEKGQYAVDQYVLRGGHALVFVDPHAESEGGRPRMGGMGPAGPTPSDLPKLFKAWGIEMAEGKVAGDRVNARKVNAGAGARVLPADYLPWLVMRRQNMNQDDPVMSQITQLNLASAGILKKREGAKTRFEPLVTTSAQSMAVETAMLGGGAGPPDVLGILRAFKPGMEGLVLAARVTGEAESAFPDGPPKPKEGEGETKPETKPPLPPHAAKAQKPIAVIVVGDTDMLDDRFWVQVQDFFGQRVAVPSANNGDFVANALDYLAGGGDLLGLRGRGTSARPFERVRRIEAEAETRLRGTERELRDKLEKARKDLREAESPDKGGTTGAALTPQQQQAIEGFRSELLQTRKQLREVQSELRRDIDRLEARVRFANIGLVPILVGLAALIAGVARVARRRRRAATGAVT